MISINYWRPAIEIARSTNAIEARIARLQEKLVCELLDDPAMQKELAALKSRVAAIR
jgi:hypothetical protein